MPGYSTLLSTNLSNAGGMFVILKPFEERKEHPELHAERIAAELQRKYAACQEAQEAIVGVFGAPPVDGLGATGGIKMQIQDRAGAGLRRCKGPSRPWPTKASGSRAWRPLFTTFSVAQPQIFVDIDREKAKAQNVSLDDIHTAMQAYLGSLYVNDFFFQDRNWQVNVQADPRYRMRRRGHRPAGGPQRRGRPRAAGHAHQGEEHRRPRHGKPLQPLPFGRDRRQSWPRAPARGRASTSCRRSPDEYLPASMGYEWTELSYQELEAEKDLLGKLVFPLAVLLVFMVLAVPVRELVAAAGHLADRADVPACRPCWGCGWSGWTTTSSPRSASWCSSAWRPRTPSWWSSSPSSWRTQGRSRVEAVVEASRTRLRPILMTSFAFILGVLPLALAKGAGAEMRVPLGVAVLSRHDRRDLLRPGLHAGVLQDHHAAGEGEVGPGRGIRRIATESVAPLAVKETFFPLPKPIGCVRWERGRQWTPFSASIPTGRDPLRGYPVGVGGEGQALAIAQIALPV